MDTRFIQINSSRYLYQWNTVNGHKVYSLFQCQWTTAVSDTEYAQGKTESTPAFAAAPCERFLTRRSGLITTWINTNIFIFLGWRLQRRNSRSCRSYRQLDAQPFTGNPQFLNDVTHREGDGFGLFKTQSFKVEGRRHSSIGSSPQCGSEESAVKAQLGMKNVCSRMQAYDMT